MRLLRSARNDVVDDSFVFSYFRVFVIKIDLLCVLCVEDKNTFGKSFQQDSRGGGCGAAMFGCQGACRKCS